MTKRLTRLQYSAYKLFCSGKSIREVSVEMGKTYDAANAYLQSIRAKGYVIPGMEAPKTYTIEPLRTKEDLQQEIADGKRCKQCWLLFDEDLDCTPYHCAARDNVLTEQIHSIQALFEQMDHYERIMHWKPLLPGVSFKIAA